MLRSIVGTRLNHVRCFATSKLDLAHHNHHHQNTNHTHNIVVDHHPNNHHHDNKLCGASLLARSLKEQGIEYVFGVPGIPVIQVAFKAQEYGLKYVAMRSEQSASYAASAIGYLTRKPAVCLVVSGPGFINALSGMANANENGWPLVVIGGSSETTQEGAGSFQEFRQVEAAKHFSKYAARPSSLSTIPIFLEKAIRHSTYGRPGAAYIDMPADMINGHVQPGCVFPIKVCQEAPRPYTSPEKIKSIFDAIKSAKNPLIIVGKEAAYSQAENEIRPLVERLKIPFLSTPMGKGLIDDDSELSVSAARSTALKQADLVISLGCKLDWMLHFGKPPRFHENVKIVHVDIHGEELGTNTNNCVLVQADIRSLCEQMNEYLEKNPEFKQDHATENQQWLDFLKAKSEKNRRAIQKMASDVTLSLNYYAAYSLLRDIIPRESMIISEGANTMDTSRAMLNHHLPRQRLDAGSFGTMGLGTGFAIAAALHCRDHNPHKRVFCIQGDSAFGFSGMELETAYRYNLPIIFVVFNNNGVYGGLEDSKFQALKSKGDPTIHIPPLSLTPGVRYEKFASALPNCGGYFAHTPDEIRDAVRRALAEKNKPSVINIVICPSADRKAQEFPWLTTSH